MIRLFDSQWFQKVIPVIVFFILVALFSPGILAASDDGLQDLIQGHNAAETLSETVPARIYALPLAFIPNQGQYDPSVAFAVAGPRSTLFFTRNEIVITAVEKNGNNSVFPVVRQTFPGSARNPAIRGSDVQPGVANYFIGNDPSRWETNVPMYGSVLYRDLYPGTDLRYMGTEGILKREFILSPGADPGKIRLHYEGVDAMTVDEDGSLVLTTGNSTLTESPVICYQEIDGRRIIIPAGYYPAGDRDIAFSIGVYDPSFPLVIDPALVYSTYLGEAGSGSGIAVDNSGNAYLIGQTLSHIFPTTSSAYNRTFGGGAVDAFVTKLNPTGSALVYSTFLGGSHSDSGSGITVDGSGNAYVTGDTLSPDFPTTAGAYKRVKNVYGDAFVTKLNPSGSALVYSTFLGGLDYDYGRGIAVDSSGNAYVTGDSTSTDFPTTPGAFNRTFGGGGYDAYVTKLNPSGSALVYSTYLGGTSQDDASAIAVDTSGNAYVTGPTWSSDFPTTAGAYNRTFGGNLFSDAFVTKLNPAGSALGYSTYLGGFDYENSHDIAVDTGGNAYVTGRTNSFDFPTTAGAYDRTYGGAFADAFVTKLNPAGSALAYSTYLGGLYYDESYGIAVDTSGTAYVTGETASLDFPTTASAYNRTPGGDLDVFVTKLNPAGSSLEYSTYLGGAGKEEGYTIAVDTSGNAYITGQTASVDFPTTAGAFDRTYSGIIGDTFVAKVNLEVPSIVVFVPNGGENWKQGSTRTLRWNYTGSPGSYVRIELLRGVSVNRVITQNTSTGSGGSGSFSWTVPYNQALGTDYRIRINSTSNAALTDTSNANFTISAGAPITVTVPNGGENWTQGSTRSITWSYTGTLGSRVRIELLKGSAVNQVINASTPIGSRGSGSYNWTVPSAQTTGIDYRIRINSTGNASITDVSNANFTISAGAPVTVTVPNGGENWKQGSTRSINWSYTGSPGPFVKIELLRGGSVQRGITSNTSIGSGGSGYKNWKIPYNQPPGNDYRIRITSLSNAAYTDTGNANFTISAGPPVTVTVPNGGQTWKQGSVQSINWSYAGSPGSFVRIELLRGTSVNKVITSNTSIGSGGSGSASWTVPYLQVLGTDYRIRINSTGNAALTDTSNANFTISAGAPITVTVPNGRENWRRGSDRIITWSYTGTLGSRVKIELLKGSAVNRVINASTAIGSRGSGSYNWTVPSAQTTGIDYRIRINSTGNASITDVSNANFAISV